MTNRKSGKVVFIGRQSGDNECFCWDEVKIEYQDGGATVDVFSDGLRVHPNALHDLAGYANYYEKEDQKYRYSITIEKVE